MESLRDKPNAFKERMSTAEAFYQVFCALPKNVRVAVARHIFQDDEIRKSMGLIEFPNETTVKVFAENKEDMAQFNNIEELRQDLLS